MEQRNPLDISIQNGNVMIIKAERRTKSARYQLHLHLHLHQQQQEIVKSFEHDNDMSINWRIILNNSNPQWHSIEKSIGKESKRRDKIK